MPAVRHAQRDVIIRVPRAIHIPKTSSAEGSGEGQATLERQGSVQPSTGGHGDRTAGQQGWRRSASPTKARSHADEHRLNTDTRTTSSDGPTPSRYRYASQAVSSAEWNSLLIWARRQRGPQWDSATGMWQVDQGSSEYYAFSNDPARHTKLSRTANQQQPPSAQSDQQHDALGGEQGQRDAALRPGLHDSQSGIHSLGNATPSDANPTIAASVLAGQPGQVGSTANNEDSPPPIGPGGRRIRIR